MNSESSRKAAAELSPGIRLLFANQWMGKSDAKTLADWATDQLVVGRDSPSLRILAGLSGEDSREAQDYFRKALADLGIPLPNRHACLLYYSGDVAREVIANVIPPLKAFDVLWQITSELNYPAELRCWTQLELDLAIMEDRSALIPHREAAVRQACEHFLALLDCYTESGVPRLGFERSLAALRSRGWNVPSSIAHASCRLPAVHNGDQDDKNRISFFRTRVKMEDFRDLTIPWSLFLRSEIIDCRFENTDLSESSMTWCDWTNCIFICANLRGCDLRRAVFQGCEFSNAILDEADLRGAQFLDCRFSYARMNGARLEKSFGLFTAIRRRQLRLSKEQAKQITWVSSAGSEPDGG